MSTYKERVQKEYAELISNITGLSKFIESSSFKTDVSVVEQSLLKQQLDVMESYLSVLAMRVDLHKFTR